MQSDAKPRVGRSPWQVTLDVWHALFMREIGARITQDRFGWSWLFLEPILHIVIMIGIRELLGRIRFIPNVEFIPYLIVGLLSFFVFRTALMRSLGAINASRGLFAYRQIQPVDTVLVRCMVELILKSMVFLVFIWGAHALGYTILPFNPLYAFYFWLGLWLLGTGLGLVLSVLTAIIPEAEKIISMAMFPLYFLSGVLIPLQFLPHSLHPYLLWNPIPHYIEHIRFMFFEHYQSLDGLNVLYPALWTVSSLLLGLMLHLAFKNRIKAQ